MKYNSLFNLLVCGGAAVAKFLIGIELVLLGGCFVIVFSYTRAGAQPLPAPRIFNDVPSSSDSGSVTAPKPVPSAAPLAPTSNRIIEFPPPPPSTPSGSSTRYQVYVYGDSPGLLAQVKKIEPTAFLRRGEGIIQVGIYADVSHAQHSARELEVQGMKPEIAVISTGSPTTTAPTTVAPTASAPTTTAPTTTAPTTTASTTTAPTTTAPTTTAPTSASSTHSGSYFAVIPGSKADLAKIAAQVVHLGISQEYVSTREAPRGPHIAVGPFNKRGEAESWSSYLRAYGMDARVYYGR